MAIMVKSSSGQVSSVRFISGQFGTGQVSSVIQFTSTMANYKTNNSNK